LCEVVRKRPQLVKALTAHKEDTFVRRLKKRTVIDEKRVSANNARRYMETTQLAGGRSPLAVQRQMGHRTLAMTNKYAPLTRIII